MNPSNNNPLDNQILDAEKLHQLPDLPVNEEGPIFEEPWQAQAFAMAVNLSAKGYFSWKEWANVLANELQRAVDEGDPDDGSKYYHHWVAALEKLVTEKNLVDRLSLDERKNSWADAYRHTPHGTPVTLNAGD